MAETCKTKDRLTKEKHTNVFSMFYLTKFHKEMKTQKNGNLCIFMLNLMKKWIVVGKYD